MVSFLLEKQARTTHGSFTQTLLYPEGPRGSTAGSSFLLKLDGKLPLGFGVCSGPRTPLCLFSVSCLLQYIVRLPESWGTGGAQTCHALLTFRGGLPTGMATPHSCLLCRPRLDQSHPRCLPHPPPHFSASPRLPLCFA